MTAATPSSTIQMADEAFNRGDIDGMLAFYEDTAKFLFRPGELLSGKAEIHKALTQLLPMKPVARHEKTHLIEAGDIALWISKWSVSGVAHERIKNVPRRHWYRRASQRRRWRLASGYRESMGWRCLGFGRGNFTLTQAGN